MPVENLVDDALPVDSESQLLSFLYACPVGLIDMSADGSIDMCNPLAMQFLVRLGSLSSMNVFSLMSVHAPELRNLISDFAPEEGTVVENHRILVDTDLREHKQLMVLACTVVKLSRSRYVLSLHDISAQVRQERKLKEAESWFASLLDGANDFGVASLDEFGTFVSVGKSFPKQTGYGIDDLVGRGLDFLDVSDTSPTRCPAKEQLVLAAREGWHLHEDWQRRKDGSRVWSQRLIAVRHCEKTAEKEKIAGYTVVLREGQQRTVDAQKLKQLLTRDHLTGMYNRMHFFETAEREATRKRQYGHPMSIVTIDIDHFKQINDHYGHAAGDKVLKQLSQCCVSWLRPEDTMARIGGEEFAIILPETGLKEARRIAEALRQSVEGMVVTLDATDIHVTGSFGCVEVNDDGAVGNAMLQADAALYEAKAAGRNRVVAHSGA